MPWTFRCLASSSARCYCTLPDAVSAILFLAENGAPGRLFGVSRRSDNGVAIRGNRLDESRAYQSGGSCDDVCHWRGSSAVRDLRRASSEMMSSGVVIFTFPRLPGTRWIGMPRVQQIVAWSTMSV